MTGLVPYIERKIERGPAEGSAFDRLIDSLVPGEPPDDDFHIALRNAAFGALVALAGALALLILPSADSVRESDFILVGKRTAGNVVSVGEDLAVPLLFLSLFLLSITGILWLVGNKGEVGAAVCAMQPGIGAVAVCGAAIPWLFVALVVVFTIVIWLTLIAFVLAVLLGAATG